MTLTTPAEANAQCCKQTKATLKVGGGQVCFLQLLVGCKADGSLFTVAVVCLRHWALASAGVVKIVVK